MSVVIIYAVIVMYLFIAYAICGQFIGFFRGTFVLLTVK